MKTKTKLLPPFSYFGGKRWVSDKIWRALGQPAHYIEPFFGSGAVLLLRPDYNPKKHMETVNDKDAYVANVWRALQYDPDGVAKICDWPVNQAELHARRKKLLVNADGLMKKMVSDDKYYDVELAGYWIYCTCNWLGSRMLDVSKRVDIQNLKTGKRPELMSWGSGINRIGIRHNTARLDRGVQEPYNDNIYTWFRALAERLRYVRVVCGDWTQVCGKGITNFGDVGVLFDPPYSATRAEIYLHDSWDVAHDVREWCITHGAQKKYRIVLCGYFDEHKELLNHGWTYETWSAPGGYARTSRKMTRGKTNRHLETLFYSPYCYNKDEGLLDISPKGGSHGK